MAKLVKVLKEHTIIYSVETDIGKTITDDDAITIVKKRMDVESPLGIIEDKEVIKKFTVSDA